MSQQKEENKLFCVPNPAMSRMLMCLSLSSIFAEADTKMPLIDDMMNWTKFLYINLTMVSLVFRAAKELIGHLKIVKEYHQI